MPDSNPLNSTTCLLHVKPRTWVEIDLDAVAHNISILNKKAGPGRLLMACVKSDAYGHGLVEISKTAESAGVDRLAVARVDEGVTLRRAGLTLPIQVLMEPPLDAAMEMVRYNLIASLSSRRIADCFAGALDRKLSVHVEVDTGMGRVPLQIDQVEDYLSYLKSKGCFTIEGLFSHFSSAGEPHNARFDQFTRKQLQDFKRLCAKLAKAGLQIPLRHIAGSDGVAFYPESYLDMIRPGAWVYGYKGTIAGLNLKPVLSWKTNVLRVIDVPPGRAVGYEMSFCPERNARIAHLPVGYGDGYPRSLSGLSQVLIRGQRVPLVGLIGMESMMVDVSTIPGELRGEEVVLIGFQGSEQISATELANKLNMFGVMITCGIKEKVMRVFSHNGPPWTAR